MKKTRLLSLVLSIILVLCMIPFTVSAADPAVEIIDGEKTVFVSSFGRMNYEGKTKACYRSFMDALNALGKDGGTIIFSGTAAFTEFNDIEGRGPVKVIGTGTKNTGNILDFSGMGDVELKGDIILNFLVIKMAPGAFLLTNGHNFRTENGFDTYNKEIFVRNGDNIIDYPDPPSVAPGTTASGTAGVKLNAGVYTTLAAGSANGKTVNSNTLVSLDGGKIENVVGGNWGNGTMTGNAKLIVGKGEIANLIAGSAGGTVNGNVTVEIGGGSIQNTIIGASEGATVNGNVIVAIKGGDFASAIAAGKGTVTGKKIIFVSDTATAAIDKNAADYIIKISGGHCEAKFDGTTLTGFSITDPYGIPAKTATINGASVSSDNGIYQLAAGENTVSVTTNVVVQVNKNAKYVAGYEDGTFLPQNNMTRAEAITLLTRVITDESNIKGNVKADFEDVAEGAWYESYIGFFQQLGFLDTIATDYGATISPSQNITRAEFAELLFRISGLGQSMGTMKLKYFTDVPGKHPYAAAVNYAVAAGIVNGYEDGTFKPENNITRAEVVTMVNRMLGRTPNGAEGATSFSDIGAHWAKGQILAACNDENVTWTATATDGGKYVLTGTRAKDYVTALYDQSATLSGMAIREGVDVISEQMKKDILNTPNTEEIYADKITGQKWYVSELHGNDDNDGKTPATACKTIAGINKKMRFPKPGTAILFERGGVYRGQISTMKGIIYGSYGTGNKPIVMQSKKNYADPTLWKETQWPNVWVCADQLVNVGVIAFDHNIQDYSEAAYHETYGVTMNKNMFGFQEPSQLCGDLQFYSETYGSTSKAGELYVYSKSGNPGSRFKSIEIGENIAIVVGAADDVIIDNISFKFTGGHGMGGAGGCKNRTVTNCVYSWIGGSVLSHSFHGSGSPINYGNAVEIYGSCNGYYVKNNWMYQIYDTAVTHQRSSSTGDCIQENIHYSENLMEYVFWAIESYNAPPGADDLQPGQKDIWTRITRNYLADYNVMRLGGYGWGSIVRHRTCQLYWCNVISENYDCYSNYNILDRAYGYLIGYPSNHNEVPDKNIYIQHLGQPLRLKSSTSTPCGYDFAAAIAEEWGDKNAVVVIIDPEIEPIVREFPEGWIEPDALTK